MPQILFVRSVFPQKKLLVRNRPLEEKMLIPGFVERARLAVALQHHFTKRCAVCHGWSLCCGSAWAISQKSR